MEKTSVANYHPYQQWKKVEGFQIWQLKTWDDTFKITNAFDTEPDVWYFWERRTGWKPLTILVGGELKKFSSKLSLEDVLPAAYEKICWHYECLRKIAEQNLSNYLNYRRNEQE